MMTDMSTARSDAEKVSESMIPCARAVAATTKANSPRAHMDMPISMVLNLPETGHTAVTQCLSQGVWRLSNAPGESHKERTKSAHTQRPEGTAGRLARAVRTVLGARLGPEANKDLANDGDEIARGGADDRPREHRADGHFEADRAPEEEGEQPVHYALDLPHPHVVGARVRAEAKAREECAKQV